MLINFPSKTNRNVWQEHFGACNLNGQFYFLHYGQLPRVAYVCDGDENESVKHFSDKTLFLSSPLWIISSYESNKKILEYKNGEYHPYSGNLDWNRVKHLDPVKITRKCAKIIIDSIYEEHKNWLSNSLSKAVIESIPRIFSECTALIYELIQNAFDANATSIKIELGKNNLMFLHNGYNFTESDTNAISFVNLSSKDKDKIGFMGIGFKSVFEATAKPEIHSPPFSFFFDNSIDGGFILPQNAFPKTVPSLFTTLIYIPFRKKHINDLINEGLIPEEKGRNELGFSRRIFLHLLKERNNVLEGITEVETPYVKFKIEKGDLPNSYQIFDVENGLKTNQKLWLYFEKEFRLNQTQIADFLRSRGIKNKELEKEGWEEIISLIIPLTNNNSRYSPVKDYTGILNVYLPTKVVTGFNFDIQGNFIISAGRERLRNIGGEWNRELFSYIGELIVKIFEWCKSPKISSLIALPDFYSLIPDWNKIEFLPEDILENVRSRFVKLFNSKQLIPIETNGLKKTDYKYPYECIVVDKTILNLFRKRTVEKLSQKKIVLEDLDKGTRQKILDSCDVKEWDIKKTITLLSKRGWTQYLPKFKSRRECNKWLSELYAYLNQYLPKYSYNEEYKEKKDKILNCYIFPVEWSDSEKRYKFNRFQFGEKKLYRLPREQAKLPLEAFQRKINILDQSFEDYIRGRPGKMTDEEKLTIEGSRSLLERTDIPILEPNTVVKDFIVPLFKDASLCDKDVLIDYTSFVCEHLKEIEKEDINILLLNRKGEFYKPEELFFSEQYGFPDIQKFFGNDKDEIFLSERYLQKKSVSTNEWVELFSSIGINSHLPCETVKEKLPKYKLKERLGEDFKNFENVNLRLGWISEDFPGGEFLLLDIDFSGQIKNRLAEIETLPLKLKKDSMRAFLKILDKNWDKEYSTKISVTTKYYISGQQRSSSPYTKKTNIHAKFAQYLLNENWVPATNSADLRSPTEVVALTDESISLSDEGVILCEGKITNSNFLQFLGLKPLPENITNLDRLVHLKNNRSENLDKYRELYQLIAEDIEEKKLSVTDVQRKFDKDKLIYATNSFWPPKDVMFNPPSSLQLYYPRLKDIYPDMENFFCKTLGCDNDNPSIEKILIYFLRFLWVKDRGMDDTLRASVLYCYRKLLDLVNEQENMDYEKSPLWGEFVSSCKVFCRNIGWASTREGKPVIFLDTIRYEDNYVNCKKITVESHLRQLNRDTNDLLPLLKLLNVSPASRCIKEEIEIQEENIYPNIGEIENNLDLLLESIISTLKKKFPDSTSKERTQLNKFIEKIEELKQYRKIVYKTPNIISTVYLNENELFRVRKNCHIDEDSNLLKIYVSDNVRIIYGAFSSELCNILRIDILPSNIEKIVQSLIDRTVGNIEGDFERSIESFYMEIGVPTSEGIPETTEVHEEEGEKEGGEKTIEADVPVSDDTTDTTVKKTYEDIVKMVDYETITLTTVSSDEVTLLDKDGHKRGGKGERGTRRPFTSNPYDKEDGERGEKIVFEKEKERLEKIGLDGCASKIKHISKKIPENPWDIESFDKNEETGEVAPIRIEVKATPDPQNLVFPMSAKQFKAALNTKSPKGAYFIYRVFDVRSSNPQISRYNFYEMFSKRLINFKNKDFYIELPSIQ